MKVIAVNGLLFGDEGKGTVVDALTKRTGSTLTVRYNGGAQAAHNVVTDDGRHHTFAQFGSGTFHGARTFLSSYVLVNPLSLFREAEQLERLGVPRPLERLKVADSALVTTPYHLAANRAEELAREERHGSCGMGIGQTVAYASAWGNDALRVGDFRDRDRAKAKLKRLRERLLIGLPVSERVSAQREAQVLEDPDGRILEKTLAGFERFNAEVEVVGPTWLFEELEGDGTVIFEGAQGALLDQDFGFQPHTTWSRCTFANAYDLLAAGPPVVLETLAVARTFFTRHGAGPFPSEDDAFQVMVSTDHNIWGPWQESLRAGAFDLVLARYAMDVLGDVDGLVVTHLDTLREYDRVFHGFIPIVEAYQDGDVVVSGLPKPARPTFVGQSELAARLRRMKPVPGAARETNDPRAYAAELAQALGTMLYGVSFGPKTKDKELYGARR